MTQLRSRCYDWHTSAGPLEWRNRAQVLLGVELPRVPGDVVAREEPAGRTSCGIAGNAEETKCTDHHALSTA